MVRSRLVLHVALRQEKVAKLPMIRNRLDPVEWLEQQVKADFSISPEIMRIYMVGEDTEALKILVDAVTDAYITEIVEKERNKRQNLIQTLRDLRDKYERNLENKRKVLKGMVINLGDKEALAAAHQKAIELRADLEKQILQNKKELRDLRIKLRIKLRIQQRHKGIPLGPAHLQVQGIGAQILPLAGVPLGTMTQQLTALAVMEADSFTLTTQKANIPPALLEEAIADLQDRIDFREQLQNALKDELEQMAKVIQEKNAGGFELKQLQDEIRRLEDVAQKAADRALALEVEKEAPGRTQKLQDAVVLRPQAGQ
jgi:hypothetical protein